MKKVFFFLLLAAATIWACNKDANPTAAAPGATDQTAVTERATAVNFTNANGLRLCGVVPDANACTTCGGENYGYYDFTSNTQQQLSMPYGEFCLSNSTGAAITVTFQVNGCVTGSVTVAIPSGRKYCYAIVGCNCNLTSMCAI